MRKRYRKNIKNNPFSSVEDCDWWKKVIKEETENCRITYFPTEDGSGCYPYVILPTECLMTPRYREAVKIGMLGMLHEELNKADTILLPEAKGFPLTYIFENGEEINKVNIVFIRKRDYRLSDQVVIEQKKAYKSSEDNHMYIVRSDGRNNGLKGNEKVVIAETIISSGNTICSLINALREQTDCKIVGIGSIYERGDGIERIRDKTGYEAKGLARLEVIEENGIVRPLIPYFYDEKENIPKIQKY